MASSKLRSATADPEAECVMHLHTRDGVAVSALEDGLLPLNQSAMVVAPHIAYHGYEGVAVDDEERARLAADLGDKRLMILRNHGTLSVAESVAEAFFQMYMLADNIGLNWNFSSFALNQANQGNTGWSAVVKNFVHCCANRSSRVQYIVYQYDMTIIYLWWKLRGFNFGVHTNSRKIIAVKTDI